MNPTTSDAICFQPPGLVAFPQAWGWQQQLQRRLLEGPSGPDAVLLLQHQPCYTLGRGADPSFLGFDPMAPPAPLHRIDRGGEVTFHGPGQLVLYPVLNLQRHGADLHLYLRQLEGVVIDVLAALGLRGERIAGLTGVWLDGCKVAAIGVGARRWISQHGLALNVDGDLSGFAQVVPCGIRDRAVGRLVDWLPQLTLATVQPLLLQAFAQRFSLRLRPPSRQETLQGW